MMARREDADAALREGIDRLTAGAGASEHEAAEPPHGPALRKILVALDGGGSSRHALAWARELARIHGSEVAVVSVVSPPQLGPSSAGGYGVWWDYTATHLQEMEALERIVGSAGESLRDDGIRARDVLATGSATGEIVRIAESEKADLVILGSHTRGAVGRLLLGSVADGVKNHVACSVLIARSAPRCDRILVATDGSRESKRAASLAVKIAKAWKAKTVILHVVDAVKPFQILLPETLADVPLPDPGVSYAVKAGRPAEAILESVREQGAGLVVMGSRGLGPIRSRVAGSVSNRVAHESPVSVLLVKGGDA